MRVKVGTTLFGLIFALAPLTAQGPPPTAQGGRRGGGFVPGQQRPPGDPAQIARGKTLYGISCTECHGADLRGGDIGGPNLLRSQVALSDRNGESIIPIIQGSRKDSGMPAIDMSPADAAAVAAYVRSVMETIGRQGMPPSIGQAAPSVLVGNAGEGQAYFKAKCGSCHSPTGDLQGIATRIADQVLQNTGRGRAVDEGTRRRQANRVLARHGPDALSARRAVVRIMTSW
jgi:cytochrome c oxidase cbb3-type subunit 3